MIDKSKKSFTRHVSKDRLEPITQRMFVSSPNSSRILDKAKSRAISAGKKVATELTTGSKPKQNNVFMTRNQFLMTVSPKSA